MLDKIQLWLKSKIGRCGVAGLALDNGLSANYQRRSCYGQCLSLDGLLVLVGLAFDSCGLTLMFFTRFAVWVKRFWSPRPAPLLCAIVILPSY